MHIYPESLNYVNGKSVCMARIDECDMLVTDASLGFAGTPWEGRVVSPLNHAAATRLRELIPFTAPTRVLNSPRSFGVGDRLGIATPGHIRVFRKYDARPVLVQQSIRELTLTGRTYEDVLDAATFAVFRDGFRDGFGADGDHLKKPEDIAYALSLGFSMITLDLSDHIRSDGTGDIAEYKSAYLGKSFDVSEGLTIAFSEEELARCVLVYGEAIGFAAEMYDRFLADGKYRADFEISIDEISSPTTPAQHYFVASELLRRGVKFATIAPRFTGEFQKGIDYIGDPAAFARDIAAHAKIARHFGYKLSVHSGSDKFSVFPIIGAETREVYHVKTAGTNWLEAMRIVAEKSPALYREVHAFALSSFCDARRFYHVTTDLSKIPNVEDLSDSELPGLLDLPDARQLIHITYGHILQNPDLKPALYSLWREEEEAYAQALNRHIGRHLELLGCPRR